MEDEKREKLSTSSVDIATMPVIARFQKNINLNMLTIDFVNRVKKKQPKIWTGWWHKMFFVEDIYESDKEV